MNNNQVLSIQEAANRLGVSTKTLRRWEERGILTPQRTAGNQRRYTQEQLIAFTKTYQKQKNYQTYQKENNLEPQEYVYPSLTPDIQKETKKTLDTVLGIISSITPTKHAIVACLVMVLTVGIAFQFAELQRTLRTNTQRLLSYVIPAEAGIHTDNTWIPGQARNDNQKTAVLAADTTTQPTYTFRVRIPSTFDELVTFKKGLKVAGVANIEGDLILNNNKIEAGRITALELTANNVLYSVKAGSGVAVTSGQNPTISNTGVLSLQGSTGAVTLTAGTGITIDGTKITNSLPEANQNLWKTFTVGGTSLNAGSTTDTFTFASGNSSELTLTLDTTNKKLTLTPSTGFYDNGTAIQLTTAARNVGIGTATPTSFKLQVAGTIGPNTTNTYDLGSSTLSFRNVYAQNLYTGESGAVGYFQRTSGSLAPTNITDDILLGATATDSALIKLSGTTGSITAGTYNGNTITTGTGTLTLAAGKTVSFAGAFTTSGANDITLTTSGATNITIPTTGTLFTNTASANQTITSTQNTGTVFGITDTTNIAGAMVGQAITLSGTGTYDQTGLQFALSGATGTNLNDILGSGSTWKVSTTGNGTFNNLTTTNYATISASLAVGYSNAYAGVGNGIFAGNVGIGTTLPSAPLSVGSTSQFQVSATGAVTAVGVNSGSGLLQGTGGITITGTGNINATETSATNIGNSTGALTLASGGTSAWTNTSGNLTISTAVSGILALTSVGALNLSAGTASTFTLPSSSTTAFNIQSGLMDFDTTNSRIGIGTTSPLSTLDVRGSLGTGSAASISANSSFAGLVVDNKGVGDIFTASSSGLTRFIIGQNGNVTVGGSILPSTDLTYDLGSATYQWNKIYAGEIIGGASGAQGYWQRNTQALSSVNITDDLLLGASATSSALVKFTGTAANDSWVNTGKFGIGTTAPAELFSVGSSSQFQVNSSGAISSTATGNGITLSGAGTAIAFTGAGLAQITTVANQNLALMPGGTGNVGIGTTTTLGKLTVAGNIIPTSDGAYDLGSSSYKWQTIYASSIVGGATGAQGYWQRNSQALSPINITDDLLLGSNATASAIFGFINVGGGTPTATISSNLSIKVPTGADAATSFNVLNGAKLNFQTSVGGDALLTPRLTIINNGNVGINAGTPGYSLQIATGSGALSYNAASGYLGIGTVNSLGTGTDGACSITDGTITIDAGSSNSCAGRATADAVSFNISSTLTAGDTTLNVGATPTGLAVNDEILVINLRDPNNADATNYGYLVESTATAGGANTLTDSAKSWTTNAYVSMTVAITSGTGQGQQRTIASNTATVLTVTSNWTTNPDNTSVYKVLDSNAWSKNIGSVKVGQYETHYITNIAGNVLNLDSPLKNTYTGGTYKVMIQRIPQYTTVAVGDSTGAAGSAVLTVGAYNNTTGKGGVIFFRATGAVTINSDGKIDGSEKGYAGGASPADPYTRGNGGLTYNGTGGTGGTLTGGDTSGSSGQGGAGGYSSAGSINGAGTIGGAGGSGGSRWNAGGGGGGGYGTVGTASSEGYSGNGIIGGNTGQACSYACSGGGGGTYGSTDLSRLLMGSGGASGAQGDSCTASNAGGNGGGIVFIGASSITNSGSIAANGGNGGIGCSISSGASGDGGGGAGGSIYVRASSATLGSSLVSSSGGATGGGNAPGGAGGTGRIRIDSDSSTGTTSPTAGYTSSFTPSIMANRVTNSGDLFGLNYGASDIFRVASSGNITSPIGSLWKPSADAQAALGIANAAGTSLVSFDTANSRVGIGTTTPGSALAVSGGVAIGSYTNFAAPSNGLIVSGNVGIGTTSPLGMLDLTSNLGTLPAASISAQSSFAALLVDNKGVGDLIAASSSGLARFTVSQTGNITAGTYNGNTITTGTGTLTLGAGKTLTANSTLTLGGTDSKTLTVNDSTTLGTNSITFAGGEVLTLTAVNALTLTTTGSTNVTLPTTGTLLTNTASANQTITSTQNTGTVFGITDTTAIAGAIVGQAITLSGSGVQDQTGLQFALSGATGTNLNDILGSGSTWKVSTTGDATFNNLSVSKYATVSASLAVGYASAMAGVGNGIFAGNVGIGTTAPSFKLQVASGGISLDGGQSLFLNGNNTSTEDYIQKGYFRTANASGQLYIGTNNENNSNGPYINLYNGSASSGKGNLDFIAGYYAYGSMYGDINFMTNSDYSTPSLTIQDTRNVGIGVTDPGYLLELNDNTNTPAFALSDDDIAHGVTTVAQTDSFFHLSSISTTDGGAYLQGIADNVVSATALQLRGIQASDPTDTVPAIKLIGAKASGTGVVDLGAAETVFQVANNDDTAALSIVGSGAVTLNTSLAITGTEGSTVSTITAGDAVISDGSLAITDDDDAASFSLTNNTATTIGAGINTAGLMDISSTSLTTGNLVNLETTTALTTGRMLNITSTSTALTTGNLLRLDWTPGSATTSTGDLFTLNIGTNGTAANLLNILDASSSIFSVSETAVTTSLPTNFTSSGDVSIAYDINFTNPTASYIKSQAPLYLESGETFNSSDLTLKTYNQGSIILSQANTVASGATSYGVVLDSQLIDNAVSPTTHYSLYNVPTVNITGDTLSNMYSSYIGLTNSAGTITTWYGSYIAAPTGSGTTSNKYALVTENGAGNVGIGTTAPLAALDVRGNLGTVPTASISANSSFAALVVDNTGAGDIFTASSSGLNRFVISQNGNVGIGTNIPQLRLDVRDAQDATAAAQIFNTSTNAGADGLVIKLGNASTTVVATTNHFLSFETSGIGIVGSIQGNGGTGIQLAQSGIADFAEYLPKDSSTDIPFGSLVCVGTDGKVSPCQDSSFSVIPASEQESIQNWIPGQARNDNGVRDDGKGGVEGNRRTRNGSITGVASEHPFLLGGNNLGDGSIAVGFVGQVRTLVSTESGEIKPGDMITVSSVAGVGKKAVEKGFVVGRALEGYACTLNNTNENTNQHEDCIGKILVLVSPTWYDPQVVLASDGLLATFTSSSAQGDSSPKESPFADNNVSSASSSLDTKYEILNTKYSLLSAQVESLQSDLASISAVLGTSTSSAFLSTLLTQGDSSPKESPFADDANATISGQLMVLGRTTVSDLGVTGNITAGLMTIKGMEDSNASLNTVGDLYLQNNLLGGINMMAGKITIDTSGNIVTTGEVTAKKINIDTTDVLSASLGTASISAGLTSTTIYTSTVTPNSKIFITPKKPVNIGVTQKVPGVSFTVQTNTAPSTNLLFDWWAVDAK